MRCRIALFAAVVVLFALPQNAANTKYIGSLGGSSYNISAGGGGGYQPAAGTTLALPIDVTNVSGRATGTYYVTLPASLPEMSYDTATGEVVFATPFEVVTRLRFSFATITPQQPDRKFGTYIDWDIGSNMSDPPICEGKTPTITERNPGTYEFDQNVTCNITRIRSFTADNFSPNFQVQSFMSFTIFGNEAIVGFLANVYSTYYVNAKVDIEPWLTVVQVVQDRDQTVPLVADKSTAVRIFGLLGDTDDPALVTPEVSFRLRGFRGAAELPGSPLPPLNYGVKSKLSLDQNKFEESANFILPSSWVTAGDIRLEAEADYSNAIVETNEANNRYTQVATFHDRPTLDIGYVLICPTINRAPQPPVRVCPTGRIANATEKMQRIYPIKDGGVTYRRMNSTPFEWRNPLRDGNDLRLIIARLRRRLALRQARGAIGPDQLFGWVGPVKQYVAGLPTGTSNPVWNGGEGLVSVGVEFTRGEDRLPNIDRFYNKTIPHEIGHNLGLRHTNTPDDTSRDANTDWPYGNSWIQEAGFDPIRRIVIPHYKRDLMSYQAPPGSNIWIAPHQYKKLFNGRMVPRKGTMTADVEKHAIIGGTVSSDGNAALDAIMVIDATTPPDELGGSGNHCIRFWGVAGILDQRCLSLDFVDPATGTPSAVEAFVFRLRYPDGTMRVVLNRGESELASISLSSNAPSVAFVEPTAGQSLNGTQTIRWTGSDPDGDPLTYAIEYSSDNGASWTAIETDLHETELTINTAELFSGSHSLLRVVASDGLRTAEAQVGPFTVVPAPIADPITSLDFGSVDRDKTSTLSLPIANRGDAPLTITGVSGTSAEFSVTTGLPANVGGQGSGGINVRFAPAGGGLRGATLTVATNDPATPTYEVLLSGNGVPVPNITTNPEFSVNFGDVAVGANKPMSITVQNTGTGDLVISQLSSSNSAFAIGAVTLPLSVTTGNSASIPVTFAPVATGYHSASISILSNAVSSPGKNVGVFGTGTGTGSACTYGFGVGVVLSVPAAGATGTRDVYSGTGCNAAVQSNASWIRITTGATGSPNRTFGYTVLPNSGPTRSGTISIGNAFLSIMQAGKPSLSVIPAAASAAGALGSFFRTSLQLHNPHASQITGAIVFRPANTTGDADNPSFTYAIPPYATQAVGDLLPMMETAGIGSLDVMPSTGPAPVTSTRIFNDAGAAGTTGMSEDLLPVSAALVAGDEGILIAPAEPSRARYNIGFRTLEYGATLNFTIRDRNGVVKHTASRVVPATFFGQQRANDFFGLTLGASDTIYVSVSSGSAIVYGVANDNVSQDPSLQIARVVSRAAAVGSRRHVPVVGSARGDFGAVFRTAAQLHNPTASTIRGRMIFHFALTSGQDTDPSLTFEVGPNATIDFPDVLGSMGITSAIGSIDIDSTQGAHALALFQIFNDLGAAGTFGLIQESQLGTALTSGQSAILLLSPDRSSSRMNIGLRSLGNGATMTIQVRNESGAVIHETTRTYPARYFTQLRDETFLGIPLQGNESMRVTLTSGSAYIYGALNDNKTNDPSLRFAAVPPTGN